MLAALLVTGAVQGKGIPHSEDATTQSSPQHPSQTRTEEDVILLKNGKYITGIIETEDPQVLVIRLYDGSLYTIKKSLIARVARNAPLPPSKPDPPADPTKDPQPQPATEDELSQSPAPSHKKRRRPKPQPPAETESAVEPEPSISSKHNSKQQSFESNSSKQNESPPWQSLGSGDSEVDSEPKAEPSKQKSIRVGVGVEVGFANSVSWQPWFRSSLIFDIHPGTGGFVLRLEPGMSYFGRSTNESVLTTFDPHTTPPEQYTAVVNNVKILHLGARALFGYDLHASLALYAGGIVGYAFSNTDAILCGGGAINSSSYGASAKPLFRLGSTKSFEIGLQIDYLRVLVPRCSNTLKEVKVPPNTLAHFVPGVVQTRETAWVFGLELGYLF